MVPHWYHLLAHLAREKQEVEEPKVQTPEGSWQVCAEGRGYII